MYRIIIILKLFTVCLTLKTFVPSNHLHHEDHYKAIFERWTTSYSSPDLIQNYSHYSHVLENFATNEDFITETNKRNLSYRLGHNSFSHMDRLEWRSFRESSADFVKPAAQQLTQGHKPRSLGRRLPDLPAKVNWLNVKGIGMHVIGISMLHCISAVCCMLTVVTPVKQQGLW